MTLVIADSSDPDAASAARGALPALRAPHAHIRYAGRAERSAYAPRLAARAGVDPALVAYALCGDPRLGADTGANRNVLLLDSAGEPLVFTDDDVRARAARPPSGDDVRAGAARPPSGDDERARAARPPSGDAARARAARSPVQGADGAPLALTSGDPYQAWFAEPGQPVVPEGSWEPADVLALHEALLGAGVARAALHAGDGLVTAARAPFYQRLARRGGRVVTTQLGCAGDHGMGASFSLLLLGGASRERLLASQARFEDAFARRRILRSPVGPVISDTVFCMSMSLGVDARALVPPFSPAGRNSDGLFGAVTHACLGDAFAAFLPWAVEHVPPGERTATLDHELAAAGRPDANDLVRAVLGAVFEGRGPDAAANLARAGRALSSLAARPRDAEHLCREQTMRSTARLLALIHETLVRHGRRPDPWARMLDRFAATLRGRLTSPAAWLPRDLVTAHGEDEARRLFLVHLDGAGRLFEAWPALFEAARELRAEGVRPSVELPATTEA